jgi:hypothetical protein
MVNKICQNCHQTFLAKGWKYKTCSRNCDYELRNKKKFIKNIHCCDNCKKIFSNKRTYKYKFCSLQCSQGFNTLDRFGNGLDNRLEKKCKDCKKIFPNNKKYFYLEKSKKTRANCKECCVQENLINRKKRRKMGLLNWSKAHRRKIKAKELGISYESWCLILKLKKEISSKRKLLNVLKIRLNKFKQKKGRDINHYRFFYKVTNKDWANYTKDSPSDNSLIYRIKYNYDTEFNVKERMRNQLTKKRKKYPNLDYAIRNAVNNNTNTKYCELFDYTIKQLQDHLEEQFTLGMNWVVFRAGEIHIDHIKPQSLFNLHDDNQIKKCWSLDNLQPLWAADNLAKSNFYVEDL